MHVAYDLRYAADHFSGIARHAQCLFEALLEQPGPERYTVLWNPALAMTRFDLGIFRRHPRVVGWVDCNYGPMSPATMWQVGGWLRSLKPDVYFSPYCYLPLGAGCPSVLTVHDVWPLRLNYGLEPWKREVYRMMVRLSAQARFILTVSEFSRREIQDVMGIDPARIRAVQSGVPPTRGEVVPVRPHNLPDRPFAITVGVNYPYKNFETLIEAWARMGDQAPLQLVGTGRQIDRYPKLGEMAQARGMTRVSWLGQVSEAELEWLYHHATVLVFPTTYEGFGFPLVEAFARGLPAIASDIPALRELDNGAARFVPARDADAWVAAVREVTADAAARRRMTALGLERVRQLSYHTTAAGVLAVLREAAGESFMEKSA